MFLTSESERSIVFLQLVYIHAREDPCFCTIYQSWCCMILPNTHVDLHLSYLLQSLYPSLCISRRVVPDKF